MLRLNLTLPTPAENLALDEALLDHCECHPGSQVLRFWMPTQPFVVLGNGGAVAGETHADTCDGLGIPILRRASGGGTILQGPGCLNYALILEIAQDPALASIPGTNRHLMEQQRQTLEALAGGSVRIQGHTDLTWNGKKFSGNAQRRKKTHLLFHGTFLLQFDLSLVARCLKEPVRQPAYRNARPHAEFITNLPLDPTRLMDALANQWKATTPMLHPPVEPTRELVANRYSLRDWTHRL